MLVVPTFQRILRRIAQLPDGGPDALAQLDVELNGSDSIFVGIHKLPPGSPSFRPHPQWVTSAWKSTQKVERDDGGGAWNLAWGLVASHCPTCASAVRLFNGPLSRLRGPVAATPCRRRRPACWPARRVPSVASPSRGGEPERSVCGALAVTPHADDTPKGQPKRPCRAARPYRHRGACRQRPSRLQGAARLRLGEKRAGQFQHLVGTAQFLGLTL